MITLIIELNAKLQPIHRVEMFEEPLEKALQEADVGELVGGGTLQLITGEIKNCDIELSIKEDEKERVISFIQRIKIIPKGSKIICGETTASIGSAEGMAIYLNGTDLPSEIYQTNDVNELISCLEDAIGEKGHMYSWWEGSKETALYFYGQSFNEMKEAVKSVISTHPLCNMSRIEQIA
ncbi:MAG: hypothetical protein E7546_05895 [Ruminococcaceae bacterium]|nr:hypothetical protein [Oscillospiraceae bacterium]